MRYFAHSKFLVVTMLWEIQNVQLQKYIRYCIQFDVIYFNCYETLKSWYHCKTYLLALSIWSIVIENKLSYAVFWLPWARQDLVIRAFRLLILYSYARKVSMHKLLLFYGRHFGSTHRWDACKGILNLFFVAANTSLMQIQVR